MFFRVLAQRHKSAKGDQQQSRIFYTNITTCVNNKFQWLYKRKKIEWYLLVPTYQSAAPIVYYSFFRAITHFFFLRLSGWKLLMWLVKLLLLNHRRVFHRYISTPFSSFFFFFMGFVMFLRTRLPALCM